ncbi:MAG: GDCCVxC domain-containing (seleno)protein [Gammaproteobacteria bacterium]
MKGSSIILDTILTCLHCGQQTEARMPIDACQFLYKCPHCHTLLKPKFGDCCVFCSYGSVPCPPKQKEHDKNCC